MKIEKIRRRFSPRSLSKRDGAMLVAGMLVVLAGVTAANYIKNRQVALPYRQAGITAQWIPGSVRRYEPVITEMAKKYNVDADLVAIIITMESGGSPKAESQAGAKGLMQVTAPTAKDIAAKFLKEPRREYDLWDPRTNIEFGTAYLAHLRDVFGTPKQGPEWVATVELVAAGYNGGPGTAGSLERGEGLRDTEPVVYSRDAFNMWRERHAAKSPTFDRWAERGGSRLLQKARTE